jgi:ATPase family associated with various cellular activities (AAA)/Winged helix domain, variant
MSASCESDWAARNQAHLTATLDRVRAALERHLGRARSDMPAGTGDATLAAGDDDGAAATSQPPALDLLAKLFGLSAFERRLLAMCAGVELDAQFAALCRDAAGASGPTFSLALAALPDAHWSALTPSAPLRYWGMVEIGPSDSLVTAPLRIDERILHYLAGVSYTDERLQAVTRPHVGGGEVPPAHRAAAGRIAALWATAAADNSPWPAIQLVGEDDAGLADVAAAACELRGLDLRVMRASDVPTAAAERKSLMRVWEREAALAGSALLLVVDDADRPESLAAAAAFVERSRAALVLAGREPLRLPQRTMPRFDIHKPSGREQAELWRRSLAAAVGRLDGEASGDGAVADAGDGGSPGVLDAYIDRLTNQFNLGPAAIATAAAMTSQGEAADPEALAASLWETCRAQSRARLDDLAQRIETPATWDDLVLPGLQMQILRDVVTHVRQRAQVYDRWGFAAKSGRGLGISALFAGASGTGKTLAAEVMANELRLDLYRIDLSQVVSKYIGETEKNLRRVFDAAEAAGAVLLFDEADALFGKRSEVKDSHDRYANIEVSYLLQRMEAYRGLAILTTNVKQALDPAFTRRIRFVVQFPFPDAAERAEIWRRVFPASTPTEDLDPARLARLNVAGGNIRNIALGAAFLAADEQRPVGMRHVLRMARAEYAKLERPLTDSEITGWVMHG